MSPELSSPFPSPDEESCLPALPVHTRMPHRACGNFSLTHSFLQETWWELPPWAGLVTGNSALAPFPSLTISLWILLHRARFMVGFFFNPKSAASSVGMCQRGITPLHLDVIHLAHLCGSISTAGASVTERKCASAQNPSFSWIFLWSLSCEELLETISLQGSEISHEDFSALPLLFLTSLSCFSEYHLPLNSPAQQQNQSSEGAFLLFLYLSVSPLVQETSLQMCHNGPSSSQCFFASGPFHGISKHS